MRLLKKTSNTTIFTTICIVITIICLLVLLLNKTPSGRTSQRYNRYNWLSFLNPFGRVEYFTGSPEPLLMQDQLFPFSYDSGMGSSQNNPLSGSIASGSQKKHIYCIFDNNPYISYIENIAPSDIPEVDTWVYDYFKSVHLECNQHKPIYKIIMLYSPKSFSYNLRNLNITGYWINVVNTNNIVDRSMIVSLKPKKNIFVIPKYKNKAKLMASQIFAPKSGDSLNMDMNINMDMNMDVFEGFNNVGTGSATSQSTIVTNNQQSNLTNIPCKTYLDCTNGGICCNVGFCTKENTFKCPTQNSNSNESQQITNCIGNYNSSLGGFNFVGEDTICPKSQPYCLKCNQNRTGNCIHIDKSGTPSQTCPSNINTITQASGATSPSGATTHATGTNKLDPSFLRLVGDIIHPDMTDSELLEMQRQHQQSSQTQPTTVNLNQNTPSNQAPISNLLRGESPWQQDNLNNQGINIPSAYNSCAPSLDPIINNQSQNTTVDNVAKVATIPQQQQPNTAPMNPFANGFPSITLPLKQNGETANITIFAFNKPPNYVFNNHDYILKNINSKLKNNVSNMF